MSANCLYDTDHVVHMFIQFKLFRDFPLLFDPYRGFKMIVGIPLLNALSQHIPESLFPSDGVNPKCIILIRTMQFISQ